MVRFIAAISVVTVWCFTSAVQAQTKPPAKRPVAPVSRARLDEAPARDPLGAQNPALNQAEEPLPPELEKLLIDWAAASENINRLEGEHLRRVYDLVYEVEKLSQGRFYYEKPDKGRINITSVNVTKEMLDDRASGRTPTKKKKKGGMPYDLKSDQDECWSCNGLRVFELDVAKKDARVAQVPSEMQGANIMHSPLPFLFGMPPETAKMRFQISLMKPIEPRSGVAYLHILPRHAMDAGNWASADVILDLKTFLPRAVQLVDPAGTKITVYSFTGLKLNEPIWFDKLFDKQDPKTRFTPDLRGFNINSSADSQPEPAAKPGLVNVQGLLHTDAVIELERQGLKRDKKNKQLNTIELEAGPAAKNEKDIFTVKSQDPPPGTPLEKGMKVRITIWTKPDGAARQ